MAMQPRFRFSPRAGIRGFDTRNTARAVVFLTNMFVMVSVPERGFVALIHPVPPWRCDRTDATVSVPERGFVALIPVAEPDADAQAYDVSVPERGFVALIRCYAGGRTGAGRRRFSPRAGIRGFDTWQCKRVRTDNGTYYPPSGFQSPSGDSWL